MTADPPGAPAAPSIVPGERGGVSEHRPLLHLHLSVPTRRHSLRVGLWRLLRSQRHLQRHQQHLPSHQRRMVNTPPQRTLSHHTTSTHTHNITTTGMMESLAQTPTVLRVYVIRVAASTKMSAARLPMRTDIPTDPGTTPADVAASIAHNLLFANQYLLPLHQPPITTPIPNTRRLTINPLFFFL